MQMKFLLYNFIWYIFFILGILGSSLERPDGLQKELLAAIRRKISKSRDNQAKTNVSANIDVSPSSNSVGSTQQPPFFRPISFPTQERNRDSRVKIYLRVPDEKSGSNVKIPKFSRIQVRKLFCCKQFDWPTVKFRIWTCIFNYKIKFFLKGQSKETLNIPFIKSL